MKAKILIPAIAISLFLYLNGCYTQFAAPKLDSGQQVLHEDSYDAADSELVSEGSDYYFNPSIPPSLMENNSWQFYYNSPWWQENTYYHSQRATANSAATEHREFDRRTNTSRANDHYTPVTTTAPAPHLSKPAEETKPSSDNSKPNDSGRDFDRRSQTSEKESSQQRSRDSRQPNN